MHDTHLTIQCTVLLATPSAIQHAGNAQRMHDKQAVEAKAVVAQVSVVKISSLLCINTGCQHRMRYSGLLPVYYADPVT